MSQALRFSIISIQDQPWPTMVEQWKRIEGLGFDSLWIADHFVDPFNPRGNWLDGWTLLSALATQTTRIRVGTLVTNFIYRNPAMIAKQALTVDHISGGRLELGLGATTEIDPSHAMTGAAVWSPAERVGRFREVVAIVDGMLRNEVTTYTGRYYQVGEAQMHPSPVQKPRPPLTIAAGGRATLKIAAKYADAWNSYGGFDLSSREALERLREHSKLLEQYCGEIGRDPKEITHSYLAGFTEERPFASTNAFTDFVDRYQEEGVREFIFYYDRPGMSAEKHLTVDMSERIAAEAIPALRSRAAG
jgi:alkanesulfonate monooxygenase SsuD/methylene tetrahydromethanopterin reductase-like flavin-dependent oxidoreductase (luciferase family)